MPSKIIGFCLCLAIFFVACKKPATPVEQVKSYIAAMDTLDYRNASRYLFDIDQEDIEHNEERLSRLTPAQKTRRIEDNHLRKYAFTEQEVTDTKAKVIVYLQTGDQINHMLFKLKKKGGAWLIETIEFFN